MDAALLDRARAAGVTVLEEHEALEPILERRRVRGMQVRRVGRDSGTFSIACPVVVAADGRKSVLARALHPGLCEPLRAGPGSWFGLKTHLEGDASRLGGRIELHLFDGGYVGLGAVESDRINVCLMTRVGTLRRNGGSPERLLRETVARNPAAAAVILDAATCGRWLGVGPLRWGVRRPAAAGALFVGDAAGTIDPFAGEGMSNAMRSAELALPWVVAAAAAGDLDDRLAREYTRIWRRAFKPVTRRVRHIGRLFERPALASPLVGWLRRGGSGWLPRLVNTTRTGARA
jgi:flavin-dependent dehydrogenase